ncbi:GNAT family N-acetyltransferase [Streptomyces sp. NPDC047022]|uniref:GNAT family N-acetyltransferase n=1 Tax=Streptomyces sp. NPDC047022 TaxID=3155737 RepID=UPI0033D22D20
MRSMDGEQVTKAVTGAVAALRAGGDQDWSEVIAGRLEWTCLRTAEHLTGALCGYAGQLTARARDARVPLYTTLRDGVDHEGILQSIETAAVLLATVIAATPREVRGFHPLPFRSANREGFAAMAVTEIVLHTHDMAEGLGIAYEPEAELCEDVLTRLFPHVRPGPDHWRTLLWATGRGDLPGHAPVTSWRWSNNLVIPTERLTLQGITPAAAMDLRQGGSGGFEWLDGSPYEGTRDAAGMLVKAYESGVHRPEWGMFALVRSEDGRAVGAIGFHGTPDEEERAEIGYDLVEGARGHGYATEALCALADWAMTGDGGEDDATYGFGFGAKHSVKELLATVERTNIPSQRVVERAGFAQVGEGQGTYAYALRP